MSFKLLELYRQVLENASLTGSSAGGSDTKAKCNNGQEESVPERREGGKQGRTRHLILPETRTPPPIVHGSAQDPHRTSDVRASPGSDDDGKQALAEWIRRHEASSGAGGSGKGEDGRRRRAPRCPLRRSQRKRVCWWTICTETRCGKRMLSGEATQIWHLVLVAQPPGWSMGCRVGGPRFRLQASGYPDLEGSWSMQMMPLPGGPIAARAGVEDEGHRAMAVRCIGRTESGRRQFWRGARTGG